MSRMPTIDLPPLTYAHLILDRETAYEYGHQTHDCVKHGYYLNKRDQRVDITAARDAAKRTQVTFRPGATIPVGAPRYEQVHITMHNQTTLDVAQARVAQGYTVAMLNFASATTPGGGWLDGSRAQEESLARSSAMVYALQDDEWYNDPSHRRNPFYDDTVIVTRAVPFFRTHAGVFLDAPWYGDVITSAAVQAKAVQRYMPNRVGEIAARMRTRVHTIFKAATTLDADVLILGAWGCGAFGNDPEMVADAMAEAMQVVDMRRFQAIDMVVADTRTPTVVYDAFARRFG